MSFDEALRRVFDAAVQELTVLANEERNRARRQGTDDGRTEGVSQGLKDGREQGRTEGLKEGHERGRAEGREEAARASQALLQTAVAAARAESAINVASNARLLDAMRTIDAARTLGDVLDTLATTAAAEAGRAGVLLVRGGHLDGWKFAGFGSSLTDPSSVHVAIDDAGRLADVVRSGQFAAAGWHDKASAPAFADLASGRESYAAPLTLFGETVAVLYADQGHGDSSAAWREALEVLARHAARALEALTAIKAARAVVGVRPESLDRASPEDPDEADSSARRYAKLLVSEIKLYHEPEVVAGRRARDLASRLGGEISRARVLYEQRVPATVRDRSDYFRDELVRTLANGDDTLLRLP
jgi:hypothetical protein